MAGKKKKGTKKKQLAPPPAIVPADEAGNDEETANTGPEQTTRDDTSDSDDQFTDARSTPMTPRSPAPPRAAVGLTAMATAESAASDDDDDDDDDAPADDGAATEPEPTTEFAETIEEPEGKHTSTEEVKTEPHPLEEPQDSLAGDEDDGFGDDFDDFEEGGEDEDFDDFDDGFQAPEETTPTPVPVTAQTKPLPFSIPDFDGLGADEVLSTSESLLTNLFPSEILDIPTLPALSNESSIFLTPRSASLWSQLVAPPPLAPPDWIRSRTRRLFLVSLGVPVDLDEILPASKQHKLVLPSLNLSSTSPRTSSDSRTAPNIRQGDGNASSTSADGKSKREPSPRPRKGAAPEPRLDIVSAKLLCSTTEEALDGMTDEELNVHISKLQELDGLAKVAHEYWKKKTDEKIGDREAFEGVIENLVKHARKVRK